MLIRLRRTLTPRRMLILRRLLTLRVLLLLRTLPMSVPSGTTLRCGCCTRGVVKPLIASTCSAELTQSAQDRKFRFQQKKLFHIYEKDEADATKWE